MPDGGNMGNVILRITDLLNKSSIQLNAVMEDKEDAINQMVDLIEKSGNLSDKIEYKSAVLKREKEGTTGIGDGIAIPHGKSQGVKAPAIAASVVKDGVDFESLDDSPCKLIFLIAAPFSEDNIHLDVLSRLSELLMDDNFTNDLINSESVDEFIKVIEEAENKKLMDNDILENKKEITKILAVTGCPTGIAHTYMAAEALKKASESFDCSIKVETRGSGGAKNILTDEEIRDADCIIIASDTQVPMERFDGKKLIFAKVSEGISKPSILIERAISKDAPIYHSSNQTLNKKEDIKYDSKKGHSIYKHLMNGVSHMLPFVVGGGILIALAFLIDGIFVDIATVKDKSTFGSITETAAFFKKIGGYAFAFMLPVLAGYISMSIGDRPALAIGMVGGYMASVGKSGFLGALLIGFIAGYLLLLIKKVFSKLPEALEGIKPVLIYPLVGILLIGLIMTFIIEPPVGALNTELNNALNSMSGGSKIILGIILGGMMSVDLGGPVNKAAYVFGVAAIAEGNYDIMAAVMVGGMVPPTAIALATIIFKNKFTKEERKAGPVNFIMGFSFITEGAIPFAASDPLRVLPSLIIGSATAGALSMAFGCELMAPHGGIFVFPVVENGLMYLLSLLIGTITATIFLGILKKKKEQ